MGSTRREFLARSGALAGVALAGGGAPALPGGAAPAAGLTAARTRTYAALAEAVITGPSVRLPPEAVREAVGGSDTLLPRCHSRGSVPSAIEKPR